MIETVFNILKVTVVISVAFVFGLAITTFVNLILNVVFGNVIGEILSLISMYLPFNSFAVFGSLASATVAILTFLIAKKIFDLTSWSISSI